MQGCASIVPPNGLSATNCNPSLNLACVEAPQVVELPTYEQLRNLPGRPEEKQIVVAVYGFPDKTGLSTPNFLPGTFILMNWQ